MWLEPLIHEPLTRFIAQVIAIVVASRLLGLVIRAIGQPLVIAEITAGILLGPSLLGLVAPDVTATLFEPASMRVLQLVSQFGLLLFMFLIGLELDPGLLRGRAHTSVAISHSSIIVPFGLGVLLALYLHPLLAEPNVSFTAFTLFLGASMSITAFPVLARILSERRLLQSRVGAVTIACAAVDDVTAWCILAFVVASARATGLGGAVLTTVLALAYVFVMFWFVRPLLGRLGQRVADRSGLSQNVVAAVMLLLLASAWVTELIGIHALFGAFLLGAVIPKGGGLAHALAEKLEDLVLVVLLPLFFAFSGVRTQIGLLSDVHDWLLCGLIILVACVGKFGGSAIAARLTGLGWRESSALGILMNTRGLMELIVLNLGLDLGVISPKLFTMMVIMALVTTFITTPILHWIYPAERLAADLLHVEEPTVAVTPHRRAASEQAASGLTMLVCVANERSGPGLIELASALRPRGTDGHVHALHMIQPTDRASFFVQHDEPEPEASDVLQPLLTRAEALAVPVNAMSFVSRQPEADICNVAAVKGAGLVLLGWHKPVFTRSFLGGVVHQVLRGCDCDVGVFVDHGFTGAKRVLVPLVGSPNEAAVLGLARRMLAATRAEITLLRVKADGAADGTVTVSEQAFAGVDRERLTVRVVEDASPVDAALRESASGYDLVIVGLGREWGLEDHLLGGHPERLVVESKVSLLIVRGAKVERAAS